MKRSTSVRTPCPKRRNLAAISISFAALSFLYFNFEPTPAGADPDAYAAMAFAESMPEDPGLIFDVPEPAAPLRTASIAGAEGLGGENLVPGIDNDRVTALVELLVENEGIVLPEAARSLVWDDKRLLILSNIVILQRGLSRVEAMPGYSVNFYKQERVDGSLLDGQMVRMKIRHEPFSVYMKWITGDKGRELLYVDGQNEGKMLVHAGGWKARLVPALKLDPCGSIAMRESRHPCKMAGIKAMLQKMLEDRLKDLVHADHCDYRMVDDQLFDERPCTAFQVEHFVREYSPTYRKSVYFFDKASDIPVFVKNHGWAPEGSEVDPATLDEETLIEHYTFTELDTETQLASADFDRENRKYKFRR